MISQKKYCLSDVKKWFSGNAEVIAEAFRMLAVCGCDSNYSESMNIDEVWITAP